MGFTAQHNARLAQLRHSTVCGACPSGRQIFPNILSNASSTLPRGHDAGLGLLDSGLRGVPLSGATPWRQRGPLLGHG
eukprot:10923259-Alexandrium_andersonii.AAC.1